MEVEQERTARRGEVIDMGIARIKRPIRKALAANPSCKGPITDARIAVRRDDRGRCEELVVEVNKEPEGYVYGHVFEDKGIARWRALLVFSVAAAMTGSDEASMAAFRRIVVQELNCEPVMTYRPGDASAVTDDSASAIAEMASQIACYSAAAVLTSCESGIGFLDCTIFDAYGIREWFRSLGAAGRRT